MHEFDSFEMPFEYKDSDKYIRAIRDNLIRKNGEIKAGAFKTNKGGVSVTRCNDSVLDYALKYMEFHFEGVMAVFPRMVYLNSNIYEKYSPSQGYNKHHWELYANKNRDALSEEQIDAIIEAVDIFDRL